MAANLNLDMRVSPRDKIASWPAALAQRHMTERELYQREAFDQTLSCMCKSFRAGCGLRAPSP